MKLFRNDTIKVEYLKLMWPDEDMDHFNNVILIFDKDGYSSEEYDEIYNWFKNIIECNNLSLLDKLDFLGQGGTIVIPYDSYHENVTGLICYIDNGYLQKIASARELYDMYMGGYTSYYIIPKSKLLVAPEEE